MALVTILAEFKNGRDIHFRAGQVVETDEHGARFQTFIDEGLLQIPRLETHEQTFVNFRVQQRRGLGQFVDMMNIAGLLPGDAGPGQVVQAFEQSDLVAGILTVTHSFAQQYIQVDVYDNNDQEIIPSSITAVDANNVEVDMSGFIPLIDTFHAVLHG